CPRSHLRPFPARRSSDLALGAGALDDGVEVVWFEVHDQAGAFAFASTCVTGSPVAWATLCGRSSLSHFERCFGSVETITSSNFSAFAASMTAAEGSGSPTD